MTRTQKNLMLLSTAITALLAGAGPGLAQSPGPVTSGPIIPNYDLPNFAYSPLPYGTNANGTVVGGLRKFIDPLPGLLLPGGTTTAKRYIPVAAPMGSATPTGVPRDGDYYEIAVVDYTEKMHSDMPGVTHLRGYVQIEPPGAPQPADSDHIALTYPNGNPITYSGQPVYAYKQPHYLGPLILATKNKPTRLKFYNLVSTGDAGKLLLPVDPTLMGAGTFDIDWDPNDSNHPLLPGGAHLTGTFTQNRASLHLHGGNTPWISDGTPHQWVVPQGENTAYPRGVSTRDVPDMPSTLPAGGAMTFFWSNEQSGRLMFYHDHVHGLTRLNVYAGEAAGYLLVDPVEEDALAAAGYPGNLGTAPDLDHILPLVIQDRTFVWGNTVAPDSATGNPIDGTWNMDPLWADAVPTSVPGDFWFPHIYMPNQNPLDLTGANAHGRWDYGPWFWPPQPSSVPMPVHSAIPESFMDTPIVNGAAYPYVNVEATKYRLPVLNACNDRMFNLQFYVAEPLTIQVTLGGSGYTDPTVAITAADGDTSGATATATATVVGGVITAITVKSISDPGFTLPPTITITDATGSAGTGAAAYATVNSEVPMVPAVLNPAIPFPTIWKSQTPGMTPDILDQRQGGVPDPVHRGPGMIQIATEGGFLPSPMVITNVPVGFEQNKRNIVVLNVAEKSLFLGPAERAEVVVDFTYFAGKTVILYNDSPAPVPAGDPRNDNYTGNLDYSINGGPATDQGGAPSTLPGYGPNIRTIMQFRVAAAATPPPALPAGKTVQDYVDDTLLASLQSTLPVMFKGATTPNQPAPIIPQPTYNPASGGYSGVATYAHIQDNSLTFTPVVPLIIGGQLRPAGTATTVPMQPKCIQELFDNSGRMNSLLGTEMAFTTAFIQTTLPFGYVDPVTESIPAGETQIWKITHNGVDTHAIHFHLVNVQVINRVGWDGAIRPPDINELGWKETVRMHPLEDIIVAATAIPQTLPFPLPNSKRPLDVTSAQSTYTVGGALTGPFTAINPVDGTPLNVTNVVTDFGWEYVWHCHLLGHEENDMMRPLVMPVASTYHYVNNTVKPLITISPVGTPSATGWYRSAIVNITATNQPLGAPVASITYWTSANATPTTVAGASASITVAGSVTVYAFATDAAVTPNVSATVTLPPIKVDGTAPVLTGKAVGASATGWNSANVTAISLTATDAQSGLASFTYRVTQGNRSTANVTAPVSGLTTYTTANISLPSTATASQTVYVTYTLSDQAGNTIANGTLPVQIKIDKTAPTPTSSVSPAPVGGWNRTSPVAVSLTGNDGAGGSGVASVTYSATGAQPATVTTVNGAATTVNITAQGTTTITFRVTDSAGNLSGNSTVTVRLDTVLPTVAVGAVTGNYNAFPVGNANRRLTGITVPVTVTETGSGIGSTTVTLKQGATTIATQTFNGGTSGTPTNRTLTFAGRTTPQANYTVTVTSTDTAGNVSAAVTTAVFSL